MKAYKGFDKNMQCRGFQFEEGKTYELPKGKTPKLCENGFHACEAPLDCFGYYPPGTSVYHEVGLDGVTDETSPDDSKRVGSKIKIGAKLDIAKICKLQFEYVRERCTNESNAEKGKPATAGYRGAATAGDSGAATAGNYGAATAGYRGAATAGYRGAATAGNYGAATAGYRGAATAGDSGAATAGDSGAATAGDSGAATAGNSGAATAGNYGAATSRGASSVGKEGIACVRGNDVKARGGLGAVLVIAVENTSDYGIKEWKAAVVDGEIIKADTWYTLKDGEFVEIDADNGDIKEE